MWMLPIAQQRGVSVVAACAARGDRLSLKSMRAYYSLFVVVSGACCAKLPPKEQRRT